MTLHSRPTPQPSPTPVLAWTIPAPHVPQPDGCFDHWLAEATQDGVRQLQDREPRGILLAEHAPQTGPVPELVQALEHRARAITTDTAASEATDSLAVDVLVLPRSTRWRQALSTALLSDWSLPLWRTGHLPNTALGALKAEARTLHRQLVPVWRRRIRHGRVLSLDADLGDALSLHDLAGVDVDMLRHVPGGVIEDERLNAVLRGLDPAERRVVFAYAEFEGTTWTEAATYAGAADPDAFGERVRRKTKRLAAEQRRRAAQRRVGNDVAGDLQNSLPVGPLLRAEG